MADYQVRRWDAWHHHMALVMLGTLFLSKQKIAGRQQWPMLSFNDLVTALAHLLPRRQLTAEELAGIINKRHRLRNRPRILTRDVLKWRGNESDKVELKQIELFSLILFFLMPDVQRTVASSLSTVET